ncbi:hypothetical protein [Streptomyces sp. NPDC086766]|uniref:hypothetical protein n=1 Tax=Streptomyces sp. NPDC086766 TaxID=3365754 RepID=UPI0038227620
MKHLDEYRDPALARRLLDELGRIATRPLVVANEGCLAGFVAPPRPTRRRRPFVRSRRAGTRSASARGSRTARLGRVTLRTLVGARRVLDLPLGELMPRIC